MCKNMLSSCEIQVENETDGVEAVSGKQDPSMSP